MCAEPGCRTREGGWESWATPGGKKVAEQGAAGFSPSVLLADYFEKEEDVIQQQQAITLQEEVSPQLCPALLLQGCLPEGVNTLSLLPAAQIPWHTCLPPPKGLGVGRGTHSKLLFLPTSEGL